ncbi:MAG TPA: hypothetical protein VM581_04845 [Magnetospirillaceae bacterium]|nr:hypothetical protein [Magnetospirillaceae bacterium]
MDERINEQEETYEITFRNGALKRLKAIAEKLDISEDNLAEVLAKGMKVMQLAEDNKVTVKSGGETYVIDLKKI